MAYDYDKIKQQYEALSPDKQKQFAEMNKNDSTGNFQKFMNQYNAEKNQTTNTAKNTGTTVSKNTVSNNNYWQPAEYQPNPSWTNKSNSYVNQWQGNYAYDEWTKYYEKQGWNQTYSSNANVVNSVRDAWNAKSYEEQQELLKNNPNMQETLTKYWITNKSWPTWAKSSPYENQWEGQYYYDWEYYRKEWDKWQWNQGNNGWDYQDNSPERMAEILRNLDDLSKSNPWLFSDYNSFYNAFIAWKGRSQEQIDTLNDYFNKMKQYNKYNNMSSDDIWAWLVNWTIPDDYLNYLKYNDPQRYAEVQEARKKGEDKIKADASMDTIANMTGEGKSKIKEGYEKWMEEFWIWMDEDNNWIDDRREHYASEEEQSYQKKISELYADILDIDNTVKHTYEDYVKKYPWASKATLMAMAQDTNSDLLREKENKMVELTKLQGYVGYMQDERQEMNKAGADSINQLRQNMQDYFTYSPAWLSELAQAKYAATNITLDQADTWTDTQKQMALEAVLEPIYQQYWDIIQRPQAQVINDVMALAKSKWITLSQALEENFMSQLKKKPSYQAMQASMNNAGWDIKNIYVDWKQQSVWYNPLTWETKPLWYSLNGETWTYDTVSLNNFWEWDYQKYRSDVQNYMRELANQSWDLESAAKNIAANMEWTYLWLNTCGYYVNDYIYGVTWEKWNFWSEIASKRSACDDTWLTWAQIWDAIVFDWTIAPEWLSWVLPEYWHVWIITWFNKEDWSIQVSSSVGGKVQNRWIKPWDKWYKNIYGTKHLNYKDATQDYWYWENPMSQQIQNMRISWDLNASQKEDLLFASQAYWIMYDLASSWDIEHLLTSGDWQKLLANLKNAKFIKNWDDATWGQVMDALKSWITDQRNLKTVNDLIAVIELKLRKTSWAAISASEWTSNFDMLLPWMNQDYDVWKHKYERFENTYLRSYFDSAWAWVDWYKYIPLFSPNSPYYKKDNWQAQETTPWEAAKWTWKLNTNSWVWSTMWTDMYKWGQFDTLFTQLNIW